MLQENGYLVLRFLAEDVVRDLDAVLDGILRSLSHCRTTTVDQHSQLGLVLLETFRPRPVPHRVPDRRTGDPGAYALVGMGALFAGIIRAPMTSVFMIFELTQDYQILVPLMVANLLAYAIATHFQPKPIYHALLEQDDIHLPGPASRFATGTARAGDIMKPVPLFIPEDSSVDQALALIANEPSDSFLVGSQSTIVI